MSSESEQAIQAAIDAYQSDRYPSIRAAAAAYGISRDTLGRRLRGGLTRQQAREPQRNLSPTQEDLLVRWIIDLDLAGSPPTFAQVRDFAGLILKASGGVSSIGINWIQRFLKRHPDIRSKVGRKIEYLRAENTSTQALQTFFNRFQSVITRYKICTSNIWNFDEHGLGMGVCTNQYVLGQSTTKRSYKKSPENRDWVTIIEACSADGHIIDPLIIFKGKDLQSTWFPENTPSNWHFRATENAFTSNQVSLDWLRSIFLPQTALDSGVRLLLCDNAGSHVSIDFMYECFIHNVQLVYMPSHSSHILQPLDVGVFSVLKRIYRKEVTNLSRFIETRPVQRSQFIEYYSKARSKVLIPRYIEAGWKGTGLSPYNPSKVLNSSQVIQQAQSPSKTPQTPHTRKRKHSLSIITTTPKSGRQFQTQAYEAFRDIPLQKEARLVLQKAAKAIDQLSWQSTEQSYELTRISTLVKEKTTTRRTRVEIDSNKAFATIEEVKRAKLQAEQRQEQWNRTDRAKQAKLSSEALQKTQFANLCIEWHINDVVDVVQ